MALAVDRRAPSGWAGLMIGLVGLTVAPASNVRAEFSDPPVNGPVTRMLVVMATYMTWARNVNVTSIPIDQAPQGYQDFDRGAAKKYVIERTANWPARTLRDRSEKTR